MFSAGAGVFSPGAGVFLAGAGPEPEVKNPEFAQLYWGGALVHYQRGCSGSDLLKTHCIDRFWC